MTGIAALAVTLAALAWLTGTDPKRRRAFRRPPFRGQRHARLAVVAALAPGGLLLIAGDFVGFVVWLSAATVAGWAIAAVPPARARRFADRLAHLLPPLRRVPALTAGLAGEIRSWWPRAGRTDGRGTATADRIAELERRVALLETALADARPASGARDQAIMRIADFQAAKAQRVGDM